MPAYSEQQKASGQKLMLKWWQGKGNGYWRKQVGEERLYFSHPNTKAGYEQALREYFASLADRRPKRPHEA